jgi:hypothetical protein
LQVEKQSSFDIYVHRRSLCTPHSYLSRHGLAYQLIRFSSYSRDQHFQSFHRQTIYPVMCYKVFYVHMTCGHPINHLGSPCDTIACDISRDEGPEHCKWTVWGKPDIYSSPLCKPCELYLLDRIQLIEREKAWAIEVNRTWWPRDYDTWVDMDEWEQPEHDSPPAWRSVWVHDPEQSGQGNAKSKKRKRVEHTVCGVCSPTFALPVR